MKVSFHQNLSSGFTSDADTDFYFSCWTFGFVILIIKEDDTLPPLLRTKMVLKKHKIGESPKNFQFKM